MTVGIGLIGAGAHGTRYRDHLARGDVPGVELRALCRRNAEKGQAQAAEAGARYHSSVGELIRDPAVDAVVVATPVEHHGAAVEAALAVGRPVLVEKPLVPSVAAARTLLTSVSRRPDVPVMVAQTLRYDALFAGLARAAAGIGGVRCVQVTWARPGLAERFAARDVRHGALLDLGVHFFDWIQALPGVPRLERALARDRTGDEDEVLALLEGDGLQVAATVHLRAPARVGAVRIFGADAVLEGDLTGHRARRLDADGETALDLEPPRPALVPVLKAFAAAVRGERNPIPPRDGAQAVACAEACLKSLGTGGFEKVEALP